MVSRENMVVGVCALSAVAILVAGVEFQINKFAVVAAVVIVGAILPQAVNNYLDVKDETE
ncbi:MAG: hypothetical protein U5J64_00535 [Halobacteriales archaeon]|nr:hypothetical protein [Halobacteriales archaeon]